MFSPFVQQKPHPAPSIRLSRHHSGELAFPVERRLEAMAGRPTCHRLHRPFVPLNWNKVRNERGSWHRYLEQGRYYRGPGAALLGVRASLLGTRTPKRFEPKLRTEAKERAQLQKSQHCQSQRVRLQAWQPKEAAWGRDHAKISGNSQQPAASHHLCPPSTGFRGDGSEDLQCTLIIKESCRIAHVSSLHGELACYQGSESSSFSYSVWLSHPPRLSMLQHSFELLAGFSLSGEVSSAKTPSVLCEATLQIHSSCGRLEHCRNTSKNMNTRHEFQPALPGAHCGAK